VSADEPSAPSFERRRSAAERRQSGDERRSGRDRRRSSATGGPPGARWLRPGIGIKRWLVFVFVGLLLIALAVAALVRQFYREASPGELTSAVLDLLTLQFLEPWLRFVVPIAVGLLLLAIGMWRLMRVVLEPFRTGEEPLSELIYQRRWRARGPRVVAIGGGRGLSVLLRGLKVHTSNITAVVTVADDGGSSGRLRRELGVPPMGDIRDCIAALADAEPTMTELLLYRFKNGQPVTEPTVGNAGQPAGNGDGALLNGDFRGHAFGNLLITALTDISGGDFEEGVRLSNRVLAVRGRVLPVAPVALTLHAAYRDGTVLTGQEQIAHRAGIDRIWLSPADVAPSPEALTAIAEADLVVLGPGSLYTSIMPGLLLPELRQALEQASAPVLFICNVATQVGETEGYALSHHLDALRRHGLLELLHAVLVNDNFRARAPQDYPAAPVRIDVPPAGGEGPRLLLRDVVDDAKAHHHDPHKLAAAVMSLYEARELVRQPARVV
jgi:uncharacterized cofD-like protein